MEFFEVIRQRHSIREFDERPIEQDKIQAILDCVQAAPSAGNLQAYEVVAVTDPAKRHALAEASLGQGFLEKAPISLVFLQNPERSFSSYGERGQELYSLQDATVACCYAHLAATALDLASCWIGAFDPESIRKSIGAPEELIPVAVLPIGYAAGEPEGTTRRPLEELIHREDF